MSQDSGSIDSASSSRPLQVTGSLLLAVLIVISSIWVVTARLGEGVNTREAREEIEELEELLEERREILEEDQEERDEMRGDGG